MPGRRLRNAVPPQFRHTGGRTRAQRGQTRVPSSDSATAASHRAHRASVRHVRQARIRARPGVLCTHTTVRSGLRRCLISGDVTSDVFHGSSRPRSTTSTNGQPARSSSIAGRRRRSPTAASPATVGHGDTSSTSAPARRARSTATSRACHVGLRSSCSASSCSSTTTTVARSGHGAHAAARAPITTSTPPAAAAHSSGTIATVSPARRSRIASSRARLFDGTTTSDGPCANAAARTGITSSVGGRRSMPPPDRSRSAAPSWTGAIGRVVRRGGGNPATLVGGLAVTRNGRSRVAPQRTAAHRARSISSGPGPRELTWAIGRSAVVGPPRGSSSTTQPRTRRPCSGTRTIEPIRTSSPSGTE